ncbi:ABC transporter ATP-binding protein [Limnochorda pilosa]|uniref:Daunorubicin ABC transporter ATPase n=1 Tax=Limnochorda pilosa TaxID=1555112 RepID=A0A0K2SFX7_LIMPI|nr:ATP-binding cassette domain-containing protein [Limnochorda pilosa]BAS26008.1 daunorubicin ABC transporter ATPase [Limnochorda pilosa]
MIRERGWAVRVEELVKSYGAVRALAGVSLEVPRGVVQAVLGPNGAGKTTLFAILSTLLVPDRGSAEVLGLDPVRQAAAVRRRIAVTFQETVLDPELTGRETLVDHGRLYGLRGRELARRVDEAVEAVQLQDALNRRTGTYSGGMKRRLELARGLLTQPELLILDEPTQGLDPQNRTYFWEQVRALPGQGTTVLLSTHAMEEAEALAHQVAIIDQGRVLTQGTPGELITNLGSEQVIVAGSGEPASLEARLRVLPFVRGTHPNGRGLRVEVDSGARRLAQLAQLAADAGFAVEEMAVRRPTLEEVFLKLTGRSLRD